MVSACPEGERFDLDNEQLIMTVCWEAEEIAEVCVVISRGAPNTSTEGINLPALICPPNKIRFHTR